MKKYLLSVLVLVSFVVQAGKGPFTEVIDEIEYVYTVEGGSAVLRGINVVDAEKGPEALELPSRLGAYAVTEIGAGAFTGNTKLTKVEIPSGVTEISDIAFAGCENLKSVTLPEGVVRIGAGAFTRCNQLKTVEIPKSLVEIGAGAFGGCTSLKKMTIPEAVTKIGEGALERTSIDTVRVHRGDEDRVKSMLEESGFDAKAVEFTYLYDKITIAIFAFMGCFMLGVLFVAWRRRRK